MARQRSCGAVALAIAAVAGVAGAAAWYATGGPGRLPPQLDRWAASWGVGATALPADWTLDTEPPASASELGLTAPLGQLALPFASESANAAWQALREGKAAKALELAEPVYKTFVAKTDAKSVAERQLFAFVVAQARWQAGKRSEAIAAARTAAGHPALGIAALRWIVARADDAGLSQVVLTLSKNRNEPALRIARARALRRNGEYRLALAELDALVAPAGTALARRAQLERMRALSGAGQEDQAVAVARELLSRGGKSTQAEEVVDWVIGSSDTVWQRRLLQRPADAPLVIDALAFTAQRRRYVRAIPAFAALGELAGVTESARCQALSWQAKAHDRKAEFDKSLAVYTKLRQDCDKDDAQRKAHLALRIDDSALGAGELSYRTGRALALQGKAEAAPWLKLALKQGMGGLDGDDAATLLQVVDHADAREVLEKQGPIAALDYAERDMVDVAVWRVALQRMIDKKWALALPLLDRLAEVRDRDEVPTVAKSAAQARYDDRDWGRGRADYFAGRALVALGKPEAAVKRWQRIVRRHPLAYYAQMALAQLQQAGQGDTAALTQSSSTAAAGPELDAAALADPRVQRARKLGQLGWHDEAVEELDAAGMGRDSSADAHWMLGDPARQWSRAALDDEAGRFTASHGVGRDQLRAYALQWPNEGNRLAWQIAYPRGFRTVLDAAAKEFELHPSIVYAICRSESGFNPKIESSAHAYGLLQLIVPTAKAMAKGLDIDATVETLKQPEVNGRLGARYLKKLRDRFERDQQMAAGYNAGGGAVGRWRKQRGDWPMDLFVEMIPFRETREYAKRVSSAIAVYRNLYHGEVAYALALTQKPVPTSEEPATEPSGQAAPPAVAPAPKPADAEALESVVAKPVPTPRLASGAQPLGRAIVADNRKPMAKQRVHHRAAAEKKRVHPVNAKLAKTHGAKVKQAGTGKPAKSLAIRHKTTKQAKQTAAAGGRAKHKR